MTDFIQYQDDKLSQEDQETELTQQNTQINQNYPQYEQNNQTEDPEIQKHDDQDDLYSFKNNDGTLCGATKNLQINFIKKVYSIISVQLLFTTLMIYLTVKSYSYAQTIQSSSLQYIAFFVTLATEIVLICVRSQARKVPNNYILLTIFTIGISINTSAICSSYAWLENGQPDYDGQRMIWIAALITAIVTVALTAYAFYTDKDYTMHGGMLFVCAVGLFLLGILAFLTKIQILYSLYLWIGVTVYSLYLIYDTQLLCENKQRNLTIDDYILGAMFIYLDIIILFLRILRILAESSKK